MLLMQNSKKRTMIKNKSKGPQNEALNDSKEFQKESSLNRSELYYAS